MTLKEQLRIDEGVRSKPYKCPAGHNTIGVGHNMDAIPLPLGMAERLAKNREITDEDIDFLLTSDISRATEACRRLYEGFDSFSRARQDALVNFVFNVGEGTAAKFVATKAYIRASAWQLAAEEILDSKWAKQVGARAERIAKALREG